MDTDADSHPPLRCQSPHPGRQPDPFSDGLCPRAAKSPAKRPQSQSTGPSLRPAPTQRRVLCQLCQAGSPSSSPPLPDTRRRDPRTRRRDQTPLRHGQPGAPSGPRSRPRQRCCAANRSRRQPRTNEIGTVLRCALRPQSRPSVIRTHSPAPAQPGRQPASQQRTMADALPPGCVPTLPPKNT